MRAFFIHLSKAIIATVYKNHFKQIISRILKSSSHDNSNNCGHIINRWTYFINGLPFIDLNDLSFFASRKVSTYLNLTLDQCHACSDLPCSGHLRHDYLIKYTYFVKCYLKRFASISEWQWSWKVNYKCGSTKKTPETWFQITLDIAWSMTSQKHVFLNGEGLQINLNLNLNLNLHYQNVP